MDNGHLIVLKIAGIEHVGCSLCVKFDKVISSKAGHAYPRMGTMTAINIRIYIYIIRINYIYIYIYPYVKEASPSQKQRFERRFTQRISVSFASKLPVTTFTTVNT